MFNVTSSAAQEILSAAARSDAAGLALRIAARQIADGSVEYGMGFDEQREDDESARFGDLTVLLGSVSAPLLAETVLDYVEIEPGRFDFIFASKAELAQAAVPNKAGGCGTGSCGSGGCSKS